MRTYIYILFLAIVFSGCRSNSSLHETRSESYSVKTREQTSTTEQIHNQSSTQTDQTVIEKYASGQQQSSSKTKDSESDEYKTKETEVDIYDQEGNLRATIRTKEQSGKSDKTKEQTRSSASSNESRNDSTSTKATEETETDTNKTIDSRKETDIEIDTEGEINKKNIIDNRLIQGIEWLYIGVAAGLIIIIGVTIYFIRKRKK